MFWGDALIGEMHMHWVGEIQMHWDALRRWMEMQWASCPPVNWSGLHPYLYLYLIFTLFSSQLIRFFLHPYLYLTLQSTDQVCPASLGLSSLYLALYSPDQVFEIVWECKKGQAYTDYRANTVISAKSANFFTFRCMGFSCILKELK